MKLPQPERAAFENAIGVSCETMAKFDRYSDMIAEWNQKFNLISASTLPAIWSRHFLDCAQLFKHIPADRAVADLGTGAGFPGLVLSIMGLKNIQLVESTGKKTTFLQEVIKDLGLDAIVVNDRIENLASASFDVLTSRALKPLQEFLPLTHRLLKKNGMMVLLKGENIEVELTESQKCWTFTCEKIPSLTHPSGRVVILKDIAFNHGAIRQANRNKR